MPTACLLQSWQDDLFKFGPHDAQTQKKGLRCHSGILFKTTTPYG